MYLPENKRLHERIVELNQLLESDPTQPNARREEYGGRLDIESLFL